MSETSRLDKIEELMLDLVKQNMQISQRMEQSNIALGQRIDGMVQQNMILGQRIDLTTSRIDASIQQLQTQQLDIAKMFYEIKDCLDKLPEAIKGEIGFKK